MITFKTAYNRIVNAYLKNELQPFESCACFIGNLLQNSIEWGFCRTFINGYNRLPTLSPLLSQVEKGQQSIDKYSDNTYTVDEIIELERLFLKTVAPDNNRTTWGVTEESLFKAMEVTLQRLKEIHESKGEIVENYIFKQRNNEKTRIEEGTGETVLLSN